MSKHLERLRRLLYRTGGCAALTLLLAVPCHAQAAPAEFVVVVNAENALTELSLDALSRIFLRKDDFWPDGMRIIVVDQPDDTRVHRSFANLVHRRAPAAVASYWQQQIFSGRRLPPEERRGDQAVLAFVRANPAAIGYLSSTGPLPPGVKAVAISGRGRERRR